MHISSAYIKLYKYSNLYIKKAKSQKKVNNVGLQAHSKVERKYEVPHGRTIQNSCYKRELLFSPPKIFNHVRMPRAQ